MSIKWMSYIWEERTDLKGSELYCAIAIADHADADGRCFPGLATIARKMRLKERQIQDLIKRLEDKNVFDVERGNGRGIFTGFQFKRVQVSTPINETKRVQVSAEKGAGFRRKRVQVSALPIYKEEPLIEPLIESVGEGQNPRPRQILSIQQAIDIIENPPEVEEENLSPTRAIEIYREIYPQAQLYGESLKDFASRLPEVDESVWRQNLLDWRLARYKATNIPDMIARYQKILTQNKEMVKNGNTNGRNNGKPTNAEILANRNIDFSRIPEPYCPPSERNNR